MEILFQLYSIHQFHSTLQCAPLFLALVEPKAYSNFTNLVGKWLGSMWLLVDGVPLINLSV